MEEKNLRPRPRSTVTRREQRQTSHSPYRRRMNDDEENEFDNNALFVFQMVVSIAIIIMALFVSKTDSDITNDMAVKIKYAITKHTSMENVNEMVNNMKYRLDNIHPTVLEIFGFKEVESVEDSSNQSDSDAPLVHEETTQNTEDLINEETLQADDAVVDRDILEQLNVTYDEEKISTQPEEIIVFPEEELIN